MTSACNFLIFFLNLVIFGDSNITLHSLDVRQPCYFFFDIWQDPNTISLTMASWPEDLSYFQSTGPLVTWKWSLLTSLGFPSLHSIFLWVNVRLAASWLSIKLCSFLFFISRRDWLGVTFALLGPTIDSRTVGYPKKQGRTVMVASILPLSKP